MASPSTCAKLRKQQKLCERGVTEVDGQQVDVFTADVVCGGRYYRYWAAEIDLYNLDESEDEGMCRLVVEEAFKIPCDVLIDYKVPGLFCRNKKKKICRRLKAEGFGARALSWDRKKVKRKGERGKDLVKTIVRKRCSDVIK